MAPDDDGISYYYAGAPTDNYVLFGRNEKLGQNMVWRIIRINGDGTIRMIYEGEFYKHQDVMGDFVGIGTPEYKIAFNTINNDNMYVGFKYTNGEVHGLATKSNMLNELETWYSSNLASYANKLDPNAGFCGDRTPSTSSTEINNQGGTGTTTTYYGGYIRLAVKKNPSLSCPAEDLYTVNNATKGNKSLTYPIGLITADEVAMAGGIYRDGNVNYYLYTGQLYWTMTPISYDYYNTEGKFANVFVIGEYGDITGKNFSTHNAFGMRPVINLKADTNFTGKGTITDPYIVQ